MAVGNLDAQRDFTDVRDVAAAYRALAADGKPGEAYLICSGQPVSIHYLLQTLSELAGIDVQVTYDPARMRPSDTPVLYGSYAKIQARHGLGAANTSAPVAGRRSARIGCSVCTRPRPEESQSGRSMAKKKERLDKLLVERGLTSTRSQAKADHHGRGGARGWRNRGQTGYEHPLKRRNCAYRADALRRSRRLQARGGAGRI